MMQFSKKPRHVGSEKGQPKTGVTQRGFFVMDDLW